jgi:membrane dipeptidase
MLTRRRFFALGAVGLGGTLWPRRARADGAWPGYGQAVIVDALAGPDEADIDEQLTPLGARALAAARASGLTAISVTVGADEPLETVLKRVGWCEREIDAHPDLFMRVRRGADLAAAKASGRVGLIYNVQGLGAVEHDLGRLELLQHLGLRVAQLTYNLRNLVGDGCLEQDGAGLSRFGHGVVERLNALRVAVDCSHSSPRVLADAVGTSKAPVIVSHTGCAALHAHPRNLSDASLRALAHRGGVAGIYFMPYLRASGAPTADDVIRHLEHAIDVAGEEHVGVGTDGGVAAVTVDDAYRARLRDELGRRKAQGVSAPGETEAAPPFVLELNGPRKLEALAGRLAARGHKDARIAKLLGGNFARVLSAVWG